MKRLLVCVLILNALLVGDRILLTFAASSGGSAGTVPCSSDVGDIDANGTINLNDAITLLSWMVLGNPPELLPNCFALEVPDLDQRLMDVESRVTSSEGRLASSEGRLASAEERLATVEGNLGGLDTRLMATEGNVSGLDGRLSSAEGSLIGLDGRVTTSEGAVTGLDTRLTTAEGTLGTTEVAVTELQGETTLSNLDCADGEIAKTESGEWVCAEDLTEPPHLEVPGFTPAEINEQGLPEYRHNQTGIEFVLLLGGTFDMGSPETEPNRVTVREPVHSVTLDPFLIAKHECTQAEYEAVMTGHATLDPAPSFFTGDDQRPVEKVSWDDLKTPDGFLARTGLSLPSEAQWEYAARGGTQTAFSFGDYYACITAGCSTCTPAEDFMWWCLNAGGTTHPVGEKQPNPFGLFDMHGNVFEWCEDILDPDFYGKAEAAGPNPVATSGSVNWVVRGGSWCCSAVNCRSANRGGRNPDCRSNGFFGFRPVFFPLP